MLCMMQVSGQSNVVFNKLKERIMKRLKYLAMALVAIGFVSCEKYVEEPTLVDPEGNLEKMTITLEAGKGAADADETRVYLGSFGSKVTYYWERTDKVGMYALSNTSSMENFEAAINELNANKNLARFQGDIYATGKGAQDLFIYWPYNSSNIDESSTAVAYLKGTGVQVRTRAQQTQSGYNITDGAEDHPSVNSINEYGAAIDLITTDASGVGAFELQHQTAYLQFELYGENTEGQHAFADGDFKVQGMRVELGKLDGTVSEKNSKLDGTFTPVAIAGNYRYGLPSGYRYSKNNVSRDDVVVKSTGAATVVSVTLAEEQVLKDKTQKLPVLAVVNPALVTKENVNCIRAVVQLINSEGTEYVERTRYIDIRSLDALKGGDYYKISYKVVDPAEASAQLDANGHSNCYIVSYPGTYTFNVNIPGNGQLPFETTYSGLGLNVNENGRFFEASEAANYEVNWLWASGSSFEAANGNVEEVVTVSLNGESGVLVVKPQAANLSGNLVVALTKKGSTSIIWSWHIWFGAPKDQHFHFANTRPSIPINNEDWYMLDRNIGAESAELGTADSYGLYYQLGRKDPIANPDEWSNTYKNTTKFGTSEAAWKSANYTYKQAYIHPMHLTTNTKQNQGWYTYAWATSDQPATANSKTLFDPCPQGYKLPLTREWDSFKNNEFEYADPASICSGVFGYSVLNTVTLKNSRPSTINGETVDPAGTFTTRRNDGNYYTRNSNGERSYRTVNLAGVSASTPIITNFPNAGVVTPQGVLSYDEENFALWAAGRIDGSSYDPHWFGPRSDSDYTKESTNNNESWVGSNLWSVYAPYAINVATSNFGVSPAFIGQQAKNMYAAPVRCIKEYNDNVQQ